MVSNRFKPKQRVKYTSYDGKETCGVVCDRHVALSHDARLLLNSVRVWAYWEGKTAPTFVDEYEVSAVGITRNLPSWF
jgi:hypothetical protein